MQLHFISLAVMQTLFKIKSMKKQTNCRLKLTDSIFNKSQIRFQNQLLIIVRVYHRIIGLKIQATQSSVHYVIGGKSN